MAKGATEKHSQSFEKHGFRTLEAFVARRVIWWLATGFSLLILVTNTGQAAAAAWVAATSALRTPQVSAFASVQTSGLMTIVPARSGDIAELAVQPGQIVVAGQVIARLGGPQVTAATVQAEAMLTSAQAVQRAARLALTIEQQKRQQHLSTDQLVDQATSALAATTAQLTVARANLDMLRETAHLRSPLAGVVHSVAVADGDTVTTGQVVATVQSGRGTWLKAILYGKPLPAGATGIFTPGDGGPPIKVSLRGPLGSALPDGGVPVALEPAGDLAPGMFGTVTLDLPARRVMLVPSEALILDKGRWWVMAHSPQGDQPVQVMPGPSQGYDTIIESGLRPGQDVVVTNAYLLYHRGVAALYHPPD